MQCFAKFLQNVSRFCTFPKIDGRKEVHFAITTSYFAKKILKYNKINSVVEIPIQIQNNALSQCVASETI